MKRKIITERFVSGKIPQKLHFLLVSDLHNGPWNDILSQLDGCDALLIPGDLYDRYRQKGGEAINFLNHAVSRLPVLVSPGNHDLQQKDPDAALQAIRDTGAILLDDTWTGFRGILIGGWILRKDSRNMDFPSRFAKEEGFRLLLCHKPEHAVQYVIKKDIDLILSGHAHGGQIRLFGQGIYAPGQGLFPKYTAGWTDEKLLISTGAGNPIRLPRWGNPPEIIHLILENRADS